MLSTEGRSFLDVVAAQSPDALTRSRVRAGAHAVLLHLRRLLPMEAEERLLEGLPAEAREMSATAEIEAELARGWRHLELSDRHIFFEQVREEGGLPGRDTAIAVAHATLGTTAAWLPAGEALYVRSQLPEGFSMLWMESVRATPVASAAFRRLRSAAGHHWPPAGPDAPADDDAEDRVQNVLSTAVDAFLARLGPDLQRSFRPPLPEELRIDLQVYHPPPPGPPEKMPAAEAIARVADAGDLDDETAETALLGALRGVKVVRPSRLPRLTGMLPAGWERLWLSA
jgi:uncharacterized protein (DUF2267 family)